MHINSTTSNIFQQQYFYRIPLPLVFSTSNPFEPFHHKEAEQTEQSYYRATLNSSHQNGNTDPVLNTFNTSMYVRHNTRSPTCSCFRNYIRHSFVMRACMETITIANKAMNFSWAHRQLSLLNRFLSSPLPCSCNYHPRTNQRF